MMLYGQYEDNTLTIQPTPYIEDGWFIEISGCYSTLFEIPQYGGEPQVIDRFQTFAEAIEATNELT